MGLVITTLLKTLILSNAEAFANVAVMLPIPFIYNFPMKPLSNFENIVFNVSDCNEWYMYKFASNVSLEDRTFFGENKGAPLRSPKSSGLLSSGANMMTFPCQEANRTVPYFMEF